MKQEANISKLFADLDHEYNSLNTHIHLRILAITGDAQTAYKSIDTKLNTIAQAAQAARAADSDFYPLQCLRDLFITDPVMDRAKLITSKGELVQGTCDWVTKRIEFTEWRASGCGLLWISGGPGQGKTMLSIYLTEYLSSCFCSVGDEQSCYSAYFFCDAKDNRRNSAVAIVRGIIFQLLEQKEDLIEYILPIYKVQKEHLFQPGSFEALWEIFLDMMDNLSDTQVYFILDGLDECEPKSLEALLIKLSKTASTSLQTKFIILSREYPRCLEASLSQFSRIRLDSDAKMEIGDGLDKYISTRVAELSASNQYPPDLTKFVQEALKEKAMGTYLWVSFVIKDLRTVENSSVEETLSQFPRGLDALYERILEQIELNHRDLVLNILRWCTFAMRPLELNELAAALKFQSTKFFDRAEVVRGKLKYCGHLINITNDTATLVHQSAHDFLTGRMPEFTIIPWFSLSNVELEHSKLASACIAYVYDASFDNENIAEEKKKKLQYPFFDYARSKWTDHFNLCGQQGSKILDEYPKFFSNESQVRKTWSWWMLGEYDGMTNLAVQRGLPVLMQRCLKERGFLLYLMDSFAGLIGRRTLIHIGSENGHLPIVKMLIENKASINSKDKDGNTPLYYAAQRGHLSVVKTLLTNGASIDRGHEGRTPLFAAVEFYHHQIAEYLLESGASPNGTSPKSSPVGWAISSGHTKLVKLLISWGADARFRDRHGWSPLGKELCHHPELLPLFLEDWSTRFCDAPSRFRNTIDFGNTTALHLACRDRDLPAIRLLLDRKWSLDINRQDMNGDTALHLAVEEGSAEVVELLLTEPARVDPKLVNKLGFNLIRAALVYHQTGIAGRLIEELDVPLPEPDKNCKWSPIHLLAVGSKDRTRVRRMTWRFKRIDVPDDNGREKRVKEALQFLVGELGVDPQLRTPKAKRINAPWHSHHFTDLTALSTDRYFSRDKPIWKGPLEPPDFCYETPLSLAIRQGHVSTVEYFLEHCHIDPNTSCRGCDGASPLHVAAQSLRDDVVDILISQWKADVHCVDDYQRTPLHLVASALPHELHFEQIFNARNRIICALVRAGAQTSTIDIIGYTPRDLFVCNRHFNWKKEKKDKESEFDEIIQGRWSNRDGGQLLHYQPDGIQGYMVERLLDRGKVNSRRCHDSERWYSQSSGLS
ncbi:ankyrin repeat-containing domain protein [Trichoderma sp. SZMC 28015]